MDFGEFILAHDADDLVRLALGRSRFSADVEDFDLALTTLEARRKLRGKVPEWLALPSLRYPFRLSAEQCSSTGTARYKAAVARAAVIRADAKDSAIADLTGGLGVDSWAFSQLFGRVLYNEMKPELAQAAEYNFRALGVENVAVRNFVLGCLSGPPEHGSFLEADGGVPVREVLGDFRPDIIYLDPARRAGDGRKVFRLEDCQPDVLHLLPDLLEACPLLLLKLSPMADITLVCKQLACVKQVHVVAAEGECKELLLLLERGYEGKPRLFVVEDDAVQEIQNDDGSGQNEEGYGRGGVVCRQDRLSCHLEERSDEGSFLFLPGKALLKAGAFDWPCRYGLQALGRHTHLYTSTSVVPALSPFGKWFRILQVLPLNKRSFKDLGKRYPQAEVTARNIPLSSDQLRARIGCRSGGTVQIFGLHEDDTRSDSLYICSRYNP